MIENKIYFSLQLAEFPMTGPLKIFPGFELLNQKSVIVRL